jgi:hypothetical protein
MRVHIHRLVRRATLIATGVAAAVVLAGATTSAQTGCVPEDFTAWAVNRGPSALYMSSAVDIHVARWSTEREKDRLARTLLDRGAKALLEALRRADPVGAIRTPMTLTDDIMFAWQELQADGTRQIILITDRPMVVWQESMHVIGNEELFTVVELRIGANGGGEGKVAIGSNITVDRSLDLIQLDDYDAEPVRLIDVQIRVTTTW